MNLLTFKYCENWEGQIIFWHYIIISKQTFMVFSRYLNPNMNKQKKYFLTFIFDVFFGIVFSRIFWRPGFFQNKAQRLGQSLFFSRNDHFWFVVIWRVFFSLDMFFIQIYLEICVHWQRADRRVQIFLTERENEKHGSLHSSVVNSVSNRAPLRSNGEFFSFRVRKSWDCSPILLICLFVCLLQLRARETDHYTAQYIVNSVS